MAARTAPPPPWWTPAPMDPRGHGPGTTLGARTMPTKYKYQKCEFLEDTKR